MIFLNLSADEDKKNFRLISRAGQDIPLRYLFRRIYLSRLAKDWSVFERIAMNRKIASYVRELVWHELFLEAYQERLLFERPMRRTLFTPDGLEGDDFSTITHLQNAAVFDPEVFWMPKIENPNLSDREYSYRYRVRFYKLVGRFSELKTLISCPMPLDREIEYKGYRFPSYIFTTTLDIEYNPDHDGGLLDWIGLGLGRKQKEITGLQLTEDYFLRFAQPLLRTVALMRLDAFHSISSVDVGFGRMSNLVVQQPNETIQKNLFVFFRSCVWSCKGLEHLCLCLSQTYLPANSLFPALLLGVSQLPNCPPIMN